MNKVETISEADDDFSATIQRVYFYALSIESRPMEARLKKKHTENWGGIALIFGRLGGQETAIVRTGVGRKNALNAAKIVINRLNPELVYSVGFAGALNPTLKKFQIIPLNYPPENCIDIPSDNPTKFPVLYTADHVVTDITQKRELFEKFHADLVDMETDGIAQVCRSTKTPLKCVRIVSDTAGENIPPDIQNILQQKSAAGQIGAALGSIFHKPKRVFDLMSLQASALQAAELLVSFLTDENK